MSTEYLHLEPNDPLPSISRWKPFRAAVLVEADVSPEWQQAVSAWLVESGCLYVVAWGIACSTWDDSVDIAALEWFGYGDIPESEFVVTTWHENEPLAEALFYLKNNALHAAVETPVTVIVHIARASKGPEMLAAYAGA